MGIQMPSDALVLAIPGLLVVGVCATDTSVRRLGIFSVLMDD